LDIAATLRKWRAARGKEYTQQHVATALKVRLKTVQSWEQGLRSPGQTINRYLLADAYGVTKAAVDILLGG
jgi:DNA-binding transcriptional regulator YiaG